MVLCSYLRNIFIGGFDFIKIISYGIIFSILMELLTILLKKFKNNFKLFRSKLNLKLKFDLLLKQILNSLKFIPFT